MDEETQGLVTGMCTGQPETWWNGTKDQGWAVASDRRTGPEIEWDNVGDLTGKALGELDLELSPVPPVVSLPPAAAATAGAFEILSPTMFFASCLSRPHLAPISSPPPVTHLQAPPPLSVAHRQPGSCLSLLLQSEFRVDQFRALPVYAASHILNLLPLSSLTSFLDCSRRDALCQPPCSGGLVSPCLSSRQPS